MNLSKIPKKTEGPAWCLGENDNRKGSVREFMSDINGDWQTAKAR